MVKKRERHWGISAPSSRLRECGGKRKKTYGTLIWKSVQPSAIFLFLVHFSIGTPWCCRCSCQWDFTPDCRRLIKHFSRRTEWLQLCNSITWQGETLKGRSRSQPLQRGRTEQIACLFLRFVPYYAAQWEKCGPTNYSPTQGHFPELESDSIRSVNSWCSVEGKKEDFKGNTVLLILWVLWHQVVTKPNLKAAVQTVGMHRSIGNRYVADR